MPGPNSAPNGDTGLVRGHEQERFIYCDICQRRREKEFYEEFGVRTKLPPILYPARNHLARHNRLRTGKTKLKRG